MNKNEAKIRIDELVHEIEEHAHRYYVLDKPVISDKKYDELFKELQILENSFPELKKKNSPTERVGGAVLDKFIKHKHVVPMLSLEKADTLDEFREFDARIKRTLAMSEAEEIDYWCDLKFDGLSMSLTYADGELMIASTRGDGTTGENVTANLKTMKSVPLRLKGAHPKFVEVRGEIMLSHEDFEKLNKSREEADEELFANPRNAAAGSMRQLDSKVTASRPLTAFWYGIGGLGGDIRIKTQKELNELLSSWGFLISKDSKLCKGVNGVDSFYRRVLEKREKLPFDIDGIVVKVNSISMQQELGFVARAPRSMLAFKYPARQETSIVENIDIQVGRTGALTPVAWIKPVEVSGVIVSRVTLHNPGEIARKDIRIDDTVVVQRAGDVIPEIVKVVIEKRSKSSKTYVFPMKCPSCGSKAEQKEDEAVPRCLNEGCPAQVKAGIAHFASKDAMNIEGLGWKIVEFLYDHKLIQDASDLYRLDKATIMTLDGFKDKSASNLVNAIEESKSRTLNRLIFALGIRHVGETLAKTLSNRFSTILELSQASIEELLSVSEVGEEVAKSIVDWFSRPKNIKLMKKLMECGVEPEEDKTPKGEKLKGLSIVVTGTLPTLSRTAAHELIEKNGGTVGSSVTKKTSFLVVGEDAGSKLDKAKSLGIATLTEEEFLDKLK